MSEVWLQLYCNFQENYASYHARFCCVSTWHIDVHSGKVWTVFIFYTETPFFEKNTKVIVHGFVEKWGFEVGNGIEPFYVAMYVYMSWSYTQKIRVTTCLFNPFNCEFLCEDMSEGLLCRCGFIATMLQFSGKLCKLPRSFLLCKYVTYRRTFWQSIWTVFIFYTETPFFGKTPRL